MGYAFCLLGASGQGKGMLTQTMIAHCESLIGDTLDVIYADSYSAEDFRRKIEQWEQECCGQQTFGGMQTYTVYVFDEFNAINNQSAWAAFKLAYDRIERHRLAGKPCRAFAIFTTAKIRPEDRTAGLEREWIETTRRMKKIKTGVSAQEFDRYFTGVTGGLVGNMSSRVSPKLKGGKVGKPTFTDAWNYIVEKQIDCVDYFPKQDFSGLLDKIAAMQPQARKKRLLGCVKATPKKRQNLVGIIADIVRAAGSAISYAAIREELDSSGRYIFRRGVEGYRRTRQITSAVHNHIRQYGDGALLYKTADGRVAVR